MNTVSLIDYLKKYSLTGRVKEAAGSVYYDLLDWKFTINYRAKSRFGCCKPSKKIIEVTSEYFEGGAVKDAEFKVFINTLLHETAHAIVHEQYGSGRFSKIQAHGREWTNVMRLLGITNIQRCGSSQVLAQVRPNKTAKHRYRCLDCTYVFESNRVMKNMHRRTHRGCGHKENGGHFSHQQLR